MSIPDIYPLIAAWHENKAENASLSLTERANHVSLAQHYRARPTHYHETPEDAPQAGMMLHEYVKLVDGRRCPICSTNWKPVRRFDRHDQWVCSVCGHGSVLHHSNEEEALETFYKGEYFV